MPVVYAAGTTAGAECHAAAGAVALQAARLARPAAKGPSAARGPARVSLSALPQRAGTLPGPRFATEPSASPRAVKPGPAAVRPAFAIVARRMPGLYDLMLLVDPTAPEERRTAAISEAESLIDSDGELVASYDWG